MASYLSISITQNSQNVANNTSNVTVKVSIYSEASWNYNDPAGYCTINGTRYDFTHDFYKAQTTEIFSKTLDIPHNADGAKTLSVYASYTTQVSLGTLTQTASKALTTIPRASVPTLSADSVDLGKTVTIYTHRKAAYNHIIKYSFGNVSGKCHTEAYVPTDLDWTVPLSLAEQIPESTSGTVVITVETYNSSTTFNSTTLIGTKSINLAVNVPDTVVPVINSILIEDTVMAKSQLLDVRFGDFVQGKSAPKVMIDADATYCNLKQYKVKFQGKTVIGSLNEIILGTIAQSETVTLAIEVEVVDSRGRTAIDSTTISTVPYTPPTIMGSVGRCNQWGNMTDSGGYMKVSCNVNIAPLNNINGNAVSLQYKKKSDANWTTHKTWNAYTVAEDVQVGISVDSSYDVRITAQDDFCTEPLAYYMEVGTTEVMLDFNASGKGMGIGKVSEGDGLEVGWAAKFEEDTTFEGKIISGTAELDMTETEVTAIKNALSITTNRLAAFLLPLARKIGLIADYVEEISHTDDWLVQKWNSGKIELLGTPRLTFPDTTSVSTYAHRSIIQIDFEELLTEVLGGDCGFLDTDMMPKVTAHGTNKHVAQIVFITTVPRTGFEAEIPLHIIGKWK